MFFGRVLGSGTETAQQVVSSGNTEGVLSVHCSAAYQTQYLAMWQEPDKSKDSSSVGYFQFERTRKREDLWLVRSTQQDSRRRWPVSLWLELNPFLVDIGTSDIREICPMENHRPPSRCLPAEGRYGPEISLAHLYRRIRKPRHAKINGTLRNSALGYRRNCVRVGCAGNRFILPCHNATVVEEYLDKNDDGGCDRFSLRAGYVFQIQERFGRPVQMCGAADSRQIRREPLSEVIEVHGRKSR
ncbi:hypothetical protein V8F20_012454 [Naviculisporaceae sp. PSN 640]